MGRVLEPVVERLQRPRPATPCKRHLDQVVGEPGVLRQQRPVQVGADRVADPDALEPVPAVVAVAAEDPAQRFRALGQIGTAAVVLEARRGPADRPRGRPRSRRCRSAARRARGRSAGRRGRAPRSARSRARSCGRAAGSRRRRRAAPRRRRARRRSRPACWRADPRRPPAGRGPGRRRCRSGRARPGRSRRPGRRRCSGSRSRATRSGAGGRARCRGRRRCSSAPGKARSVAARARSSAAPSGAHVDDDRADVIVGLDDRQAWQHAHPRELGLGLQRRRGQPVEMVEADAPRSDGPRGRRAAAAARS